MAEIKEKEIQSLSEVTVRFAGDSGDGMQLTGSQFSDTTAIVGNDLATLPDYPAEIRAPAGTLYGVSGFQLHFSSSDIHTPGDNPDVLVAMNPAALKINLKDLRPGAMIIVNTDSFDPKNLKIAHYDTNPLEDDSLSGFEVIEIPITTLTTNALEGSPLSIKEVTRSKNFFALGLMYWLFNRPIEPTIEWIQTKFKNSPDIADANLKVLKAGYYYGDATQLFSARYIVKPAALPKGTYRNISGNEASALGVLAASLKSGLDLFLGTYPITPASDILHYLSRYKNYGVVTFQAEDEIAGMASAIGAAYGGALAISTTSGPGLALKTEATGLAVMTELPVVIINVQRGGPSTGLPTKTEQADLMQSLYGRNGESPVVVLAASTPSDCFYMAFEACQIALKYMTPVILLTDGYIANGSEPWKLPEENDLPEIKVNFRTEKEGFNPYERDENLSRPWAVPGTKGLEHRIGGLEKEDVTGNVSYDPENHHRMVTLRAEKVQKVQQDVPDLQINGDPEGDLLVIGWGGTYGAITEAVNRSRKAGMKVSQIHIKHLNPLPANLGKIIKSFKQVLVPELNMGQLAYILRSEYFVDVIKLSKVKGLPFKSVEVQNKIAEILGGNNGK
ncbi:MAG: 2-oxoacid:acceptor oxidoreductase subunit alpha [Ignavibacteriales bacterium]|nr:2-oxoacid:acceptor oxidoreductase subunit alpha [Ignavibacteriales bacterium]MCF8315594.1 2-oxoacid:acceptor oxidoreductase subunit alpha [Ignavibacteriales bacterium]MCF8437213.1 2-oxoacid:acceptor oxidoreductase subunit alpha [Ignavibacteriales bacterium]